MSQRDRDDTEVVLRPEMEGARDVNSPAGTGGGTGAGSVGGDGPGRGAPRLLPRSVGASFSDRLPVLGRPGIANATLPLTSTPGTLQAVRVSVVDALPVPTRARNLPTAGHLAALCKKKSTARNLSTAWERKKFIFFFNAGRSRGTKWNGYEVSKLPKISKSHEITKDACKGMSQDVVLDK